MRRTDRNDGSGRYFRSGDRVFSVSGRWFFSAREGEQGPFPSREAAVKEASRYVHEQVALARFQNAREKGLANHPAYTLPVLPKDTGVERTLDGLTFEVSGKPSRPDSP